VDEHSLEEIITNWHFSSQKA